ncbi:TPM domain-containing protein [Loktanella sp. IMCC34160]|uniref:TPM domain-containing protein n=1 Tax=Loktanella sp. IMCC34160 TaxID=2510646 RepID=UPI0013E9B7BF|nr:TPM domain-containing protein [Loktanella sp. IMCC34160]
MIRFLAAFLFSALLPFMAQAQLFPDPDSTTVNDFSGLIDDETTVRLVETLTKLEAETGVELTVVTLSSLAYYAEDMTVEEYARALFDHWGVGKAATNDGILMMVFRDDRELWIELGLGYDNNWNYEAQGTVNTDILPQFRDGNYSAGIEAGVEGLIRRIVTPFKAGADAPERSGGGTNGFAILAAFLGIPIALVAGGFGFAAWRRRNQPCESCGQKGLNRQKEVLTKATRGRKGEGRLTLTCPHCGHVATSTYAIAALSTSSNSSSSGGSFGGGSSGGGGAGGSW